MLKKFFAAICVATLVVTTASAGVIGTATLVANPPAVNFTTDTDYNNAPLSTVWVSYVLGLSTNDGSKVSAVDVTLGGIFNQRWAFNADTEAFDPTPSSTNKTNGDTHLTPLATSTVAVAPSENNNQAGVPPTAPDTAARDYGLGTTISGAWGYVAADQSATPDFAYIVIPKGSEKDLQINVKAATNPDQNPPLVTLTGCLAFFSAATCGQGGGDTVPPVITPLVRDVTLPAVITDLQLSATDETGPIVWSALTYAGGPGKNNGASADATLGADGKFNWNPNGWKQGIHTFNAIATDSANPANATASSLVLTVNLTVPEPATLSMLGLALVGCVGVIRRRG